MYQLLPTLLDGLPPGEQQSVLACLGIGQVDRVAGRRPATPAARPARPVRPARPPAQVSYRRRPTPAELDAIAAAPWRGGP